ncbi:MAG: hypothetical protein ABI575_10980 [Oxalobacteraceae bacterium]
MIFFCGDVHGCFTHLIDAVQSYCLATSSRNGHLRPNLPRKGGIPSVAVDSAIAALRDLRSAFQALEQVDEQNIRD